MNLRSQHHFPLDCPTGKWTMLSTILASSMAFIDTTALNVILPSLQKEFNASATDLFWVLNSYLLMLASLIIVGGSLGDKLGRVKVFKTGILIFTIGSVLCGLSSSMIMLIVFRTIQGIGGAFMIPGSLAIISSVFSKEEKGKAIGTWSAAATLVTVCGPVLGGALADIGLWRFIFFINLPLGLISWITLHLKVPESKSADTSEIDWLGATVLVFGLCLFTSGLLELPTLGFSHWFVLTGLFSGILLISAFVIIESKKNNPMIPMTLFSNIIFSGLNLLTFFLYAALGGITVFLSLNLIQIQQYTQLQAGFTFLPFSLIMVVMARKMGKLTDKFGARKFLVAGPAIAGLGILWLSLVELTQGPSDYWLTFFPPFLLLAFGMSITVVPLTTAVMSSLGDTQAGIASGVNNSVTRLAGTIMNAILGAMAIYLFHKFVYQETLNIELPNEMKEVVMSEVVKLGEAVASEKLDLDTQIRVNSLYKHGFIHVYKWVGLLSAGLAFLSSAFAIIMFKEKSTQDG